MLSQLESVWRQTGRKPKELDDLAVMPLAFKDLWHMFLELHSSRGSNGFGYDPISFTELKSYADLYNIDFEPWEIQVLHRFDNIVLQLQADQAKKDAKAQARKAK